MGERRKSTPAERSQWARAAAYTLHSKHKSRQLTAKAAAASKDRFLRQVDPEGLLPEAERRLRAECARKARSASSIATHAGDVQMGPCLSAQKGPGIECDPDTGDAPLADVTPVDNW
jgi:hypothetical protein